MGGRSSDGVAADVCKSGPVGFCEGEAGHGGVLNADLLIDLDENWEVVTVPVVLVNFPIAFCGDVDAGQCQIEVTSGSVIIQSCTGSIIENNHRLAHQLLDRVSSPVGACGAPECIFGIEIATDDGVSVVENLFKVVIGFRWRIWRDVDTGYCNFV